MPALRHMARIRKNRHASAPVPVSMQINITGKCPCHCWHCEKAVNRDGRDMDWGTLMAWLDQAAEWSCPVLYSGGEPMVHARWEDLLTEGRRRGLDQSVVTSGVTFGRPGTGRPPPDLSGLDEILVSLDAADPARHDELRGVPGLGDAVMGFLSGRSGNRGIWIVHVPPVDFAGVEEMIGLAVRYGVGLIVQPYIFQTNYPGLAALEEKGPIARRFPELGVDIEARVSGLADLARRAGIVSNLAEVARFVGPYYRLAHGPGWYGEEVLPRFVCSIPWQQAVVDEHGRLQPCVFLPGRETAPPENPGSAWRRQALDYRKMQLAGQTWPECRACSCHFGANYRNSLLMFPWRNRSGWLGLVKSRLDRKLRQRRFRKGHP